MQTLRSVLIAGMIAVGAAIGPAWAEPGFDAVKLSASPNGPDTEVFSPATGRIHLSMRLVEIPAGTNIRTDWIAEQVQGVEPNYKIDSVAATIAEGHDVYTTSMSKPDAGWPVGTYRLELYVNNMRVGTMNFRVE